MKTGIATLLALMLALACTASLAQEYVSISELYDQTQAMGGWWRETFDTPNGEMAVDVPIIVPDAETMPVMTLKPAKVSREAYDVISGGRKATRRANAFEFTLDIDGVLCDFFLGNVKPEEKCYEAIQRFWIRRGSYRYGAKDDGNKDVEPVTYHYPWEIESDKVHARNQKMTLDDVMRLWRREIERYYAGQGYVIEPKRITLHGSLLSEKRGTNARYERSGYYAVDAEQYIAGFPVFGAVANNVSNVNGTFRMSFTSTRETNRIEERMDAYRKGAQEACYYHLTAFVADEEDHQIMTNLLDVRSEEHADIPLASLDRVLAGVRREIEAGHIQEMYAIRLGYLLYSNPDMTDHAWAVPRWVVDCNYITDENRDTVAFFRERRQGSVDIWNAWEFVQMPVDAQSGELLILTTGDERTFSVPEIVTWNDAE